MISSIINKGSDMTDQASNLYKEKLKDDIKARYSSMGGYLDGTMTRGEGGAGVIKFPVIGGRIKMYKLSGAIQEVTLSSPTLQTVSVIPDDFEASATLRPQDARKMGPSEQGALAKEMAKSVRRKRDDMKLGAVNAFAGATSGLPDLPQTVATIGDGSARVDILHLTNACAQIRGAGSDEEAYWVIPYMWFKQLDMYKEFASRDYQGDKELPFARASAVYKRTYDGVHILALPDEHHQYGTGAYVEGTTNVSGWDDTKYLDTFMWCRDAVGSEIEWDQENMTLDAIPQWEGTPWLCKVQLSGAALGILPEGVKRIRMKAIKDVVRPA